MTACCRINGGVLPPWKCPAKPRWKKSPQRQVTWVTRADTWTYIDHRLPYTGQYPDAAAQAYSEDEFRFISNLVCERPHRATYYAKRQTS